MIEENDLPSRELPSWIDAFVEYTELKPTPLIFRKWAAVGAIAGALERRVWVRTNAAELYPNLFLVLVSPPGVGKDFAINPIVDLWSATGLFSIAPISMTHKGLIDELADEKSHKQFIQNGQWINYHSLLAAVPELGVIIHGHDLAFMSALNELFNCRKLFEERIRSRDETLRIERPHLHIVTGTQPNFLGEILPEAAYGMGFTSRIIMVYAGEAVRVSLFTMEKPKDELKRKLITDLKTIGRLYGQFTLTAEAGGAIEDWHMHGCRTSQPTHSKLIHYNTRRIMHILKLCMVFSSSRDNAMEITMEDFQNSLDLLLEAEELMPQIFKEMAAGGQINEIEEAFHLVARLGKGGPVPEHKLVQFLAARVPANQISFIIETMIRSRIIKPAGKLNLPEGDRFFLPIMLRPVE